MGLGVGLRASGDGFLSMPLVVALGLMGWGLRERSLRVSPTVSQGAGVGEGTMVRVARVMVLEQDRYGRSVAEFSLYQRLLSCCG